jgi:hypothetical protein
MDSLGRPSFRIYCIDSAGIALDIQRASDRILRIAPYFNREATMANVQSRRRVLSALAILMLILAGTIGQASAQEAVNVALCDGCTSTQMQEKAKTSGLHLVHVGNRATGQLNAYWVDLTPIWVYPMDWVVTPMSVTEERAMEFMAYSDAYREAGGAAVIDFNVYTAAAQPTAVPPYFPQSGFDITRDGSARQALLQWAKAVGNWPDASDRMSFYGKLVIESGKKLRTGEEFAIRITFRFPDGTVAKVDYQSATQSLAVIEVRDSAGNLIFTSSESPVQVDYSSYERAEARNAPDYNRGLGWLNSHGLLIVRADGGIGVRRGTVIVGGVVTVQQ